MNTVEVLNLINKRPTIKIDELRENHLYHITMAQMINTKFGSRVVVTLEGRMDVFLPIRFKNIPKTILESLNHGEHGLKLRGKIGQTYNVEFAELPKQLQKPATISHGNEIHEDWDENEIYTEASTSKTFRKL